MSDKQEPRPVQSSWVEYDNNGCTVTTRGTISVDEQPAAPSREELEKRNRELVTQRMCREVEISGLRQRIRELEAKDTTAREAAAQKVLVAVRSALAMDHCGGYEWWFKPVAEAYKAYEAALQGQPTPAEGPYMRVNRLRSAASLASQCANSVTDSDVENHTARFAQFRAMLKELNAATDDLKPAEGQGGKA